MAKAGVKVSPNELAARASPTAPRRSDLPKLDSSLLHNMQQQQFPLPASMPPASVAAVGKLMFTFMCCPFTPQPATYVHLNYSMSILAEKLSIHICHFFVNRRNV